MADSVLKPEAEGNPKAAQVRIATRNATAVGGQRAHDLRIGPQPDYVDQSRSHLNRVLVEPMTGTQLRAISEERRALRSTARAMKSNASVGIAGILTFGHEAQDIFEALTPTEQDAAYLEAAQAVAARLNSTLTGLVVHVDESAPHAHFQIPAYDLSGNPISESAKRGVLRELQTITAQVMGKHAPGIERGHSKIARLQAGASPADVINKQVNLLHVVLPREIEATKAELAAETENLNKTRKLRIKAESDLAKAVAENGAESAKAEKIRKRAAIYEKRAADAQAKLNQLSAELEAKQAALAKIEEATGEAKRDLAQIEIEKDQARAEVGLIEAQKVEKTSELDGLESAVAQKKNEYRDLESAESDLAGEIAELEHAIEAAERALQAQLKAERVERRKEALGAALGAPARLWRALTAKAPQKAPEAPPEPAKATIVPPPEPRASETMRDDLAAIREAMERKKAQQEAERRKQAEKAAKKEHLRPMLSELHSIRIRAKEDPEVRAILDNTGVTGSGRPATELIETLAWKNARAQIERLDREREGRNPPQPIPQQIQPRPEAPRRKSGPAGPKF